MILPESSSAFVNIDLPEPDVPSVKPLLFISFTLNDLKTADIKDSELEGINSFVDQVEGVKIGVTIRELPDGNTRCSMRTSGSISANEICRFFGGGGHYHAAACILEMSVYEARIIIEQVCESFLRKYESGCVIIEDVDYDEEANKDIKEFIPSSSESFISAIFRSFNVMMPVRI